MWPLKTILYFGLFWLACLMSLVNPIWGVVNYMVAYQTNPTSAWWGKPLTEVGMRFSMLAALFIVIGMVLSSHKVPRVKPVLSMWELGIVGLVAIAAVNLLIGHGYNSNSAFAFEKLWKMFVFVLIMARLMTTRNNFRLILWTFVAGSLYVGYDAYTAPPDAFWLGRLELIGGPDFISTSGTGAHLSAMLPLIGTAFLIAPKWYLRALALLSGALSVNAIILCRTRSAFIGLLCGVLAALVMAPRVRRYRVQCLILFGAVLAYSLTDNYYWHRMDTLTSREALANDAAAISRTEIWKISLQILADNPLGVGPGNFPRTIGLYDAQYYKRSTHNTLLVCLTEFGIQGGLLFMMMVGGALWLLYRSSRLAEHSDHPVETKLIAYGLLVSFVTYCITGLGTERFYCESFWWILAMPLCLYRVVMGEIVQNADPLLLAYARDEDEEDPAWGRLQHGL